MKNLILMLLFLALCAYGLDVYDIQYTDDPSGDSPYVGEIVEVTAVVTATNFSGDKYFIGDPGGGPWTGVYVYDYEHEVELGDLVTMTAEVDEYYNLTELKNVTDFSVDGTGDVPEPYETNCNDIATQESLEGVLVKVTDVEVIRNDSTGVWISDGSGECKFGFSFDHTYSPSVGDVLEYVIGMVDFSWDNFVLQPRFDDDIDMPEAEMTTIYDIQYTEEGDSPMLGATVTVHAIVTANNYRGTNYFLSDPGFGPWSGIYVYDSDHSPEIGDYVTVTAEVDEYYDLTELKNVSYFNVDSSGATIEAYPTDIDGAMQESMEGVLVELSEVSVESTGEEGEWLITDGSMTMPVLSNFDYSYTPEMGDEFSSLKGLVYYTYEEYKLEPRSDDDIEIVEMIKNEPNIPQNIIIAAYPNPFNGACIINAPLNSRIDILDNQGRIIEKDLEGNVWNPKNSTDSGVYFVRVIHSDEVSMERVLYLK